MNGDSEIWEEDVVNLVYDIVDECLTKEDPPKHYCFESTKAAQMIVDWRDKLLTSTETI